MSDNVLVGAVIVQPKNEEQDTQIYKVIAHVVNNYFLVKRYYHSATSNFNELLEEIARPELMTIEEMNKSVLWIDGFTQDFIRSYVKRCEHCSNYTIDRYRTLVPALNASQYLCFDCSEAICKQCGRVADTGEGQGSLFYCTSCLESKSKTA